MKRLRVTMILCATLVAASAIGVRSFGDDPPPAAADGTGLPSAISEFWTRWEGNKPSEAIRRAAPTPDFQRAWEPIGRNADEFQNRLGRCLGHVEVDRKAIGSRMVAVSWLALYEPTPIRVQMLYYRARDQWSPISLRIDADPARWMAEAQEIGAPEAGQGEAGQE